MAITQIVEAENPPSRLPPGQMPVEHIRAALDREARELDAWAHVGASAGFPNATRPAWDLAAKCRHLHPWCGTMPGGGDGSVRAFRAAWEFSLQIDHDWR